VKEIDIYQSGGCCFYPDCLTCPFPECLIDNYQSLLSELRKAEARQLTKQGKSVAEIAEKLGMSKRQVKRYLDMAVLTEP